MRPAFVSFALVLAACGSAQYYTVDIHPGSGPSDQSYGYGIALGMQAGSYYSGSTGQQHAGFWSDVASSFVDLNPIGCTFSIAEATDGTFQAGYYATPSGLPHAAVWNGTAASMVDLHPSGYDFSYAFGAHGGQQGGFAVGTPTSPIPMRCFGRGRQRRS